MGFALDVVGYGARSAPMRSDIQRRLPSLVAAMLAACGISLEDIEHEWTGDGVNAVLPADADPSLALPVMIRALAARLTEGNARGPDRIRLRMSVAIGLVENSATGFGGPMILDMSRLVSSAPLRAALAAYPSADLVVAISDQVHSAIIRPGYPGIPGSQFTRADVAEKEFIGPAWIWVSTRQWTTAAIGPLARRDPRTVGGPHTGRYHLAGRLGAGPASTVYLARTRQPAAPAPAAPGQPGESPADGWRAIKVFRPAALPAAAARRRLAASIKSGAAIGGPRVARVLDGDAEATRPWIATAFVPGPSLESVIEQTGPLPPRPALWLAAGVVHGLLEVHRAGVGHGSLRPSNVLLSAAGPVITDALTGWQVIAADEDGGGPRPADDLFELGGLALFAATGRDHGGHADDPDLSGCPPELLPIVRACLLPEHARPAAAEVSAQLEAAAGPLPRNWLPPAVAIRLADYQAPFPPARRCRVRHRWRSRSPGRASWPGGRRQPRR